LKNNLNLRRNTTMPRKSTVKATQDAAARQQEELNEQPTLTDPEDIGTTDEEMRPRLDSGENAPIPHTDPESSEFTADGLGLQTEGDENPASPQADSDFAETPAEKADPNSPAGENTSSPQTETGPNDRTLSSEADSDIAAPHTDPEEPEFPEDRPGLPAGDDENRPALHTDSEESEGEGTQASDTGREISLNDPDTPLPRTGIETGLNSQPELPAMGAAPGDAAVSHTDLEPAADEVSGTQPSGSSSVQPPVTLTEFAETPQPSPEERKPRRRAVKSRSGESEENRVLPGGDPQAQSRSGTEREHGSPSARRRRRETPIVSIDDRRTVETDADKLKSDLIDMIESQKGRKLLSGTIQGVERPADNPNISFAVIYHGAFKVIIPAEECVRPPEDFRDRSPADVMHYLVTKRLGAEIDYIVKGVDAESGVAAASRLEAMALKRRDYYFGSDRDGNNLLYEGISAEARVVSVIRAGMFVDLFGLETYIPLRELSYQRLIDATAHYRPGQRVLVKILTLDRSDRNNIRVTASVKQAGENPYEAALKKYTPGSRYVGTVSLVDTNGVFVSLDGGIDCLCSYPKRGRPPRGSRVTVRIIGVNNETNRIWGAITHMTTVR
jgi:hypothetical protein